MVVEIADVVRQITPFGNVLAGLFAAPVNAEHCHRVGRIAVKQRGQFRLVPIGPGVGQVKHFLCSHFADDGLGHIRQLGHIKQGTGHAHFL